MEVLIKVNYRWLSFDGRVLERFGGENLKSERIHIKMIDSIVLAPPDRHGYQELRLSFAGGGSMSFGDVKPDDIGEAQKLVAAVTGAMHPS